MKCIAAVLACVSLWTQAAMLHAEHPPVTALCFSPDGSMVVAGSQSGVRVLAWPSLKAVRAIKTDLEHVNSITFHPRGDQLLIAGGSPGEAGMVDLLSWPKGERIYKARLHDDLVHAVAWTVKGTQFITASADQTCHVIDATTGSVSATFAGHSGPVLDVSVLTDHRTVVSAGTDQVLHVWNMAGGEAIRRRHNHTDTITAIALRPGKRRLDMIATGSLDRTVRLWQPTIGRLVRFARLPSEVLCLTWTADGLRLLAGCRDGCVYSVDADQVTHVRIARVEGWVYAAAAGSHERTAIGATNGTVEAVQLAKP